MHDHLRDMGRSVIDDQIPPSRLWRPLDVLNYLSRRQLGLIMEVRGICISPAPNVYEGGRMTMPMSPWKACWMQVLEICGVSSIFRGRSVSVVGSALRLLAAHGESVITEFSDLSRELLWLRWDDYPYTSIPSHFSMKKLRVLELSHKHSNLKSLWQSDEQAPAQLRELSVQSLSKLPESIGLLKHLKKIVLSGGSMRNLPDELCQLRSLNHLDLNCCNKLQSLPNQFGNLTNLTHLDLNSCYSLQALPDSFSQLIQLQYLCLYDCRNLILSTDILRNIRTLHYLDLTSVRGERLPSHITSQSFLTDLYISCPNLKNLPTDIGELSNLRVLRVGQLKNLEHLTLEETKVQILPQGVARLLNLVELSVTYSPLVEVMLSSLRSTGDEENLLSLSTKIHSSQPMSRLKSVNLSHTGIVNLPISKEVCPNLETLEAPGCENLEEVKELPIKLVNIDLQNCKRLKKIRGLSNLTKLRYLNVSRCLELQEVELSQSASLELLEADGCCMLTKMDGLKHQSQLKHIQTAACQTGVWEDVICLKRLPSKVSSITLNMKIMGGDERDVDSILSSFRFPISVHEFSSKLVYSIMYPLGLANYRRFFSSDLVCELGLEEVRSCSALIMVFLCTSSERHGRHGPMELWLGNRLSNFLEVTGRIEGQCEWIIISLFTRESAFIKNFKIIKDEYDRYVFARAPFENKKGWAVILGEAEEWKITEIWDKLSTYAYSKPSFLCGTESVI